MPVSSKQITWRGNQASAEASDLGWRPGEWPLEFDVQSSFSERVITFVRSHPKHFAGEFCGFYYKSPRGIVLDVLND